MTRKRYAGKVEYGKLADSVQWARSGNVVTVTVGGNYDTSAMGTGWYDVGVLPDACRPTSQFVGAVIGPAFSVIARVNVQTDGRVQIALPKTIDKLGTNASVTYVCRGEERWRGQRWRTRS